MQIEQQLVIKLKREKEFVTQSETFGGAKANPADYDTNGELQVDDQAGRTGKRKGAAFLKMFRFDKGRSASQKELENE